MSTDHTYGLPVTEGVVEHIGNAHQAALLALAALNAGSPARIRPLLDMISRRLARARFQLTGAPLTGASVTVPEIGAPLTHTGSNHLDPAA